MHEHFHERPETADACGTRAQSPSGKNGRILPVSTTELLVEIYPNPVRETLTANVFTPNYENYTVSVYNQKGQKMTADVVNRTYLNVKNFPSGLYYYKVTTADKTITKRFVVR